MFDDIIKKSNKKITPTAAAAKEPKWSKEDRDKRQFMLNLLLDSEDVISELYRELKRYTSCLYCGAGEGVIHKTNCTYRTLLLRLQLEIDRYV